MSAKKKPLLSVGIIFKNEIRCIERCLKSLVPLKEHISMEIVMADTGSDDGSRAVAERYADVLIDFPWVDDFSAARNAVLERCSGTWFLSVDCDEWLDEDAGELLWFLRDKRQGRNAAFVTIRNYENEDLRGYSDFLGLRLARMALKPYYFGAIHEQLTFRREDDREAAALRNTVFHHDGYIGLNLEKGRAKRERNIRLIRAELEEAPDDLRFLLEFIESGATEKDLLEHIRRGIKLVREKAPRWNIYGPALLRYAVRNALSDGLPELEEWDGLANELFPASYFTRLDINCMMCSYYYIKRRYAESASRGEAYLQARSELSGDLSGQTERLNSTFITDGPYWVELARQNMAASYIHLGHVEDSLRVLNDVDSSWLDADGVRLTLGTLMDIQCNSTSDTAARIVSYWEALEDPDSGDKGKERKDAFLKKSAAAFSDPGGDGPVREAYTLFLPLAGKCPAGDWAAILCEQDPEKLADLLARQEKLEELPARILFHVLEKGVPFPLPDRPMNLEELDVLAVRLSAEESRLVPLALRCAEGTFADDWQSLLWARALTCAAVYAFDWKIENVGNGIKLARAFATVENNFLPRCYTADALKDGRMLPALHRYGVHLVKAFAALDAGDFLESVHALREGLEVYPDTKEMTQFILNEVKRQKHQAMFDNAPPELVALANQVRTVLARYDPDDPAVAELKATEAYQKVAHLVEG